MEPTPKSLLERLRSQQDESSWKRLFDLYTPLIRSWLHACGVAGADADDLLQEVLLVVLRELPGFVHNQQRGAFLRWLRAVAVHRLQGFRRSRQARRLVAAGDEPGRSLDEIADPAADPERLWDQQHDQHIVRRALELLEPDFTASTWHAFRRQVIDGEEPARVAAELGLSRNAVVLAKFRVLQRLRRELDGLTDG